MAACAALVSLMHIIEQIERHPCPPISLDKQQVKLLTEKVIFLQEFLEGYSHAAGYSKEPDALEMRIADAAYAAEDIIESRIVDQIHAGSTSHGEEISSDEETSTGEETSSTEEARSGEEVSPRAKISSHEEITSDEEICPSKEISSGKGISSDEEASSGEEISSPEKVSSPEKISSGEEISSPEKVSSGEEISSPEKVSSGVEISSPEKVSSREEISSPEEASSNKAISPREGISSIDLYQGLNKVIEEMDFIKKEVMEIKEKKGVPDQLNRISAPAGSLRLLPSTARSTMVEFGDILYKIMDKLTGGQPHRQTISIVGMGGIGKTTLAQNIYENQVVVQHFQVLAWGTVSQEYSTKGILVEILLNLEGKGSRERLSQMNEDKLGETLSKFLSGRTYLIILDDIWNVEVWDRTKFFFPDNNNGSRIMLTTRLTKLASELSNFDHVYKVDFLDEDKSWNLFCKHVFGEKDCPLELKEIGKKIVKSCKGLPLSISVIGGLLAKSEQTRQQWGHIVENLHSIVNLEDNEHCLQILYLSYNNLPVQLKSCFLYMGIFSEDDEISVSYVIKLWVVEGFIKPISGKSLEETAEKYLEEIIERNLILVKRRNSMGQKKHCVIHDLLRDLCLREAQKQKLFYVLREQGLNNILEGINTERRICIHPRITKKARRVIHALKSASLIRSFLWPDECNQSVPSFSFRLLRVLPLVQIDSLKAILQHVNLRILAFLIDRDKPYKIPSSICLLWNLQILIIVNECPITAPPEIWKMTQLRCVLVIPLLLPDPPSDCTEDIVLENLEQLSFLRNFKFSEEVVKRIPNIKKLMLRVEEGSPPNYCLNNIGHLQKLQLLFCRFVTEHMPSNLEQNLTFPHSLKQLSLLGANFHWEDLATNIGSLPHLQELRLCEGSCKGPHWETVEGQFPSLKFLLIEDCDLENWKTDDTHFPCLEHLVLTRLKELKEIPLSIGDIPMLQSIKLEDCSDSAVDSAKRILEEQEQLGNESLRVLVRSDGKLIVGEDKDEVEDEDDWFPFGY